MKGVPRKHMLEPSRGSQKDTFDFAMNTKQGSSVQTL